MSAKALIDENPQTTLPEIIRSIFRSLCWCTGYEQVAQIVAGMLEKKKYEDTDLTIE